MLKKAAIFFTVTALLAILFLLPLKSSADQTVQINEVSSSTGSDWVELYNPTSTEVDLANWTLSDSAFHSKQLTGTIPPLGFASFSLNNYLNNDGDSVILDDDTGNQVDAFTYTANPGDNFSFGRMPDGENFTILNPTTENKSNSQSASTPIPTPSPSSTPTLTPSPTSSPSPAVTNTPAPASNFLVTGVPSGVNSNDVFSATVNLALPGNPNATIYLKGAFFKDGSSNYFGKTLVSDNWIKNSANYSSQLKITTDGNGNWSGLIQVMPDDTDSGFDGTDTYSFKAARYSDSGSLNWSNISTLDITATDDSISDSSPSPSPSNASSSAALLPNITSKVSSSPKIATASAAQKPYTPSKTTIVASAKSFNWYYLAGTLALLTAAGWVAFKPLKINLAKLKIETWFSTQEVIKKLKRLPQI